MSMIKIENLTFSYPTSYDNVFENVSFQFDTDWKLGFVGRNGRGKTTFLNLLLGKYEYSGKILSSVQFDYFPYPVSDKNRITEDILQEICPLAEEWELMRELSYLDVDVDVLWRPFETLSNGEQTKVLIAALFLNEGHFLLIDEPTDKGYVGHKAAKMMKRSKSIEARQQQTIEQKSALLKNMETAEALKIQPLNYHTDLLASLSNVVVYYDGISVCEPVSFEIRQGERIVLDGKNGSGKSSLLKLVVGQSIDYTGTVTLGSGLVISYVPQDTSYLCGTLSEFAEENNLDESLFKAILRKMDFERVQFEKDIKDFSGGQKKKVLIAKSLCEKAHLYVWDEPLNFIDVYSRMQIEQLITEFAPTMLLVEHDSVFRDTVASKIVNI